jgi:hypothetical protein
MNARVLAPRRNGRRKIVIAGVLTALSFAVVVPMLASGAAATTPSSDINDYSLYTVQTLQLKGGGGTGRSIIDGNIGAGTKRWAYGYTIPTVNGTNEYTFSGNWLAKTPDNRFLQPAATGFAHVTLCQGAGDNGALTMVNSLDPTKKPYVVAPSTNIEFNFSTCQVPLVYGLKNSDGEPINLYKTSFTAPDIAIPAVPAVNCSAPKTISTANPEPGTYWGLTVQKNATLTLKAGAYNFCGDFKALNNARVVTDPAAVLNVTGQFNMDLGGNGGKFGTCGTVVNVNGSVNFGSNGTIVGTIVAPKSDVALGNGTNITGHVWAFAMHSDWGVNVTQCKPPTTTSTTSTTVRPPTTPPTTVSSSTTPPTTGPPTTTRPTTVPPTTTPPTTVPPTTTPPTTAPRTTTTLGDT